MSRTPTLRRVAGAVLLLTFAAILYTTTGRRKMRDFEVYWTAGARAAAGAPLYRADDGHYRFKYLPGFAVAFAPLSRVPLPAAKALWMAISVCCFAAMVGLSVAASGRGAIRPSLIALFTVLAMAKFVAHELVLGQANLAFGAACTLGLLALLRGRDALGGAIFGAATLIKPYSVLFVPYFLATRRWAAASAATLAAIAVVILPVFVYGFRGAAGLMGEWWLTATETSVPLLTNADSISVFAMYAKWLGWGRASAVLSLATIAVLGAVFLAAIAHRGKAQSPEVLEVGLAMTLIPLVTPQGWDYVLLLSTPLVALLIARFDRLNPRERAVFIASITVAGLSLFDVMGRAAYARFMALSIVTVCYLAVVFVAVRARVRGVA